MTNKELAQEIREIIKYLCDVAGKQDKYALQCCDELDKKMDILDMFQNSLTVEHHLDIPAVSFVETDDGIDAISNALITFTKNKINKESQDKLTEWVIENIDTEKIRYWLFKKDEQNQIEKLNRVFKGEYK